MIDTSTHSYQYKESPEEPSLFHFSYEQVAHACSKRANNGQVVKFRKTVTGIELTFNLTTEQMNGACLREAVKLHGNKANSGRMEFQHNRDGSLSILVYTEEPPEPEEIDPYVDVPIPERTKEDGPQFE